MKHSRLTTLAILMAWLTPAMSEVTPARIFQSHMVLQQGVPLPFWGSAAPGERVTVTLDGQSRSITAGPDGKWIVTLDPRPAEAQGVRLVFQGTNQILIEDVLVGEVWLASGQSNMAMTTGSMAEGLGQAGADAVASAKFPGLRFCRIAEPDAPLPLPDLLRPPRWIPCTPETVRNFSAVAFIFARRLHKDLQVPVGVIDSSWGGKPIEPFIPPAQFQRNPVLEQEKTLADRGQLEELKHMEGGVYARDASWLPGAIYHSRIHPLLPCPIGGVIWYQGESNSGHGEDPRHYRLKMRALIQGWRAAWKWESLPFYFVQLPGYAEAAPGWPFLREEQRLSLGLPRTGMAVTIDLDSPGIHPPNKMDVGERLALWALSQSYKKDIPFSGPLYDKFEIQDGRIILHFNHAESGLMTGRKEGLQPVRETPGTPPSWFEVRDADGQWHKADATIRGETVLVSNRKVDRPTAARYAYDREAKGCNLYNRNNLPASPFCTHPEFLTWPEASGGL